MQKKSFIGYSVILTLILNLNAITFAAAFAGIAAIIPATAFAQALPSQTPKLDDLTDAYDLDNPTRNHQTDTFNPLLEQYFNQTSRDLSGTIGSVLSTPVPSRTVDLSQYDTNRTMAEQLDTAKNLSTTHGMPKQNGSSYVSEYARKGTRSFYRDSSGQLKIKAIVVTDKVSDFDNNDIFGAEANNPNYQMESNKEDMYGDNNAIFTEGKNIHDNYNLAGGGKNASARGLKAVTRASQRGIDTNISETEPFLIASFNKVKEAETDPSTMFSACTDQVTSVIDQIAITEKSEHRCQDLAQSNFDFCEVERDIKVPVFSNTPGLRSCGVGCYEFDLNAADWKTSRCRNTAFGDGIPATFSVSFNPTPGLIIKKVTLKGAVADHFKYQLNGQTIWESNRKNQSTFGDYTSGSCNISSHTHQINTDLTARVNQILGPIAPNQITTLNFRGDMRWKRYGGMESVVRIELEDTSGNSMESKFTQYPDKCYDALTLDDKISRGLNGVYDFQAIGIDPTLPPLRYRCESSPALPICNPGEQVFGNDGRQMCYKPKAPVTCPAGSFNPVNNRCEYQATAICNAVGPMLCVVNPPLFTVALESSYNPITKQCTYTDFEHCGPWSVTLNANLTCPSGGTLDGDTCYIPADLSSVCPVDDGYVLKTVVIEGITQELCEAPPNNYTPPAWVCESAGGQPQSYSSAYCSVTTEDYRDENGDYIDTVDENGFPLPPPVDEDGEPVIFKDVATCLKPQLLPDVPDVDFPSSFCTFDEYQNIEVGSRGFPSTVLAEIPPFYNGDTGDKTWKVNLKGYRCDPSNGNLICRIDPITNVEKCLTWEELQQMPNQCEAYASDPSCVETNRTCVDGWFEDLSGRCMSDTVSYECSSNSFIELETQATRNSCTGMLPCIGGDCEITDPETNPNFVKAMVAGSIIDESNGDSSCSDPTDPNTCTVFNGEFKYCSWETTGLGSDCCVKAEGVDILAYVTLSRQILKVGQMTASGAFGSGAQGMYSTLSEPVTSAGEAISSWANTAINEVGSYVKGAYSSTMNSLLGSTEVVNAAGTEVASVAAAGAGEGMTAAIEAALNAVKQEVYGLVYDMLPEQLSELLFSAAVDEAGNATADLVLNEALTNMLSNIMAIYAAYQMIKLALTLLTACDNTEMDMGVKLAQRTCFKVGDTYCSKKYPVIGGLGACMQNRQNYCCYSSILSRIIMKDAYDQLGINPLPYGNKPSQGIEREASCQGLTFTQLSQVNFDAPSMQTALQEWVGLLVQSEEIKSSTSEQSLTGGAEIVEDASCQTFSEPVFNCTIDALTLNEICEQARDLSGKPIFQTTTTECTDKATNGQIWNAHGRKVTSVRTKENMGTADVRVQENKIQIKNAANNIDCSVFPRLPLCDFTFDVRDNN